MEREWERFKQFLRELGVPTLVEYQANISMIYQKVPDTGFIRLIWPDTLLIHV